MIAYNRHKTIEAQAQWQKKEHNYTLFWHSKFSISSTHLNEEKALKWLPYFFTCSR